MIEAPAFDARTLATPPKGGELFRFNKDNAREMALRGAQKKREKAAERAKVTLTLEQQTSPAANYIADQLASVRAQIARLDKKIMRTDDAQKLNWLASASAKLREQERILAGRPLPGHLRPKNPIRAPKADNGTHVAPVDEAQAA